MRIDGPSAVGPDAMDPGAAAAVRVRGLTKRFGSIVAVDGVDLEVGQGEMLCLLGPSGCGKTTVLRLIAGFETPDDGTVEIAGRKVASPGSAVPPERRRFGMVFQDVALFPHLSIRDNVAYGIHRDPDRFVRVAELLELVGLPGAGRRMPHELSGGMQQRVALARALAPRPDVILLDEPFSSLDLTLRTQLRGDVRAILRLAGASAIFVTHDQDEALTIADRLAVMVEGRIEQVDLPEVVYGEPATPLVARFVGTSSLVDGLSRNGIAETRLGTVRLVGPAASRGDGRVLVVLRPEHLDLIEAGAGPANPGDWRVRGRRFAGSEILLELVAPDGFTVWSVAGPHVRRLRIGDAVVPRLRDVETVAFPVSTDDDSARTYDQAPDAPTGADDAEHDEVETTP